jgi:hypothetical protein
MRMLTIVLTSMAILLVAGWAEATTLKTGHLPAATRGYSPVEKVGCGGPGRCATGLYWACGPNGKCGCVSCGHFHPYVHPFRLRL